MSDNAIIIVAAGSSSRLGQPKQLVHYKTTTLLEYTINEAQTSGIGPVWVVLGCQAEKIKNQLLGHKSTLSIIIHEDWAKGMGSSIAAGIAALPDSTEGTLLLQCDQPHIDRDILQSIVRESKSCNKGIIISDYGAGKNGHNVYGPPCYFTKAYFDQLKTLNGHEGAKKIIRAYSEDVAHISFPKGRIDVDYPEDLERLN